MSGLTEYVMLVLVSFRQSHGFKFTVSHRAKCSLALPGVCWHVDGHSVCHHPSTAVGPVDCRPLCALHEKRFCAGLAVDTFPFLLGRCSGHALPGLGLTLS